MFFINPFKGIRPTKENASSVTIASTDHLSEDMKNDLLSVFIDLGLGKEKASIYTCDLTHGYISINADYRS